MANTWKLQADTSNRIDIHRADAGTGRWVEVFRIRNGGWTILIHNGSHTGRITGERIRGRGRALARGKRELQRLKDDPGYEGTLPRPRRVMAARATRAGGKAMSKEEVRHGGTRYRRIEKPTGIRHGEWEYFNERTTSWRPVRSLGKRKTLDLEVDGPDTRVAVRRGKAMSGNELGRKSVQAGLVTMDNLRVRASPVSDEWYAASRIHKETMRRIKKYARDGKLSGREKRHLEGEAVDVWTAFADGRTSVDAVQSFQKDLPERIPQDMSEWE